MDKVRTGLDQLPDSRATGLLRGRRLAVLCHHASINREGIHLVEVLRERAGAEPALLFGPEHGLWSTHQDMEPVPGGVDPWLHLPVHSLYGGSPESLGPLPGALDGLDAVVVDLADIGSRYYTYAATAVALVRAAGRAGIPALLLDRPNPLGGVQVEGGVLAPAFRSFVGALPVPHRHGLTLGELVRIGIAEGSDPADLHVVEVQGWDRSTLFPQTGLPFVPPSPNMPSFEAALLYPGMCLLEGTTLSEGRGTTSPFEVFGAPGVDPFALAEELRRRDLPGLAFRPHVFRPMFGKHHGQPCGGVQILVREPAAVRALELGAQVLHAVRSLFPSVFAWRTAPYEFVADRAAIDLLSGDPELRERLDSGLSLDPLLARWRNEARTFARGTLPQGTLPQGTLQ